MLDNVFGARRNRSQRKLSVFIQPNRSRKKSISQEDWKLKWEDCELFNRVERFLNIFEIKHAIIGKSCVYDILRNPKNILEKYQYLTHAHWHWILNFHTSKTSLLTGMPILATNVESISYYFLLISQAFKWKFIEHFYPSWIFNPRATSPHLK